MFNLLKKKSEFVFTKENKTLFTSILTDIYTILRDNAYTNQANWIIQILACVEKENAAEFKKKVISAELLGGSGSVLDVCIADKEKMDRLDELMNSFLNLTVDSGLNDRLIKSRIIKKS